MRLVFYKVDIERILALLGRVPADGVLIVAEGGWLVISAGRVPRKAPRGGVRLAGGNRLVAVGGRLPAAVIGVIREVFRAVAARCEPAGERVGPFNPVDPRRPRRA